MRIEKIGDTSIDCGGGKLLELKRESVEGMCNFVTEDIHLPTWEVTSVGEAFGGGSEGGGEGGN